MHAEVSSAHQLKILRFVPVVTLKKLTMKTALLLIPEILQNIDRQEYLAGCIEKMDSEGYLSLSPGIYDLFFKINSREYIEKTLPICDAVFFFVDFGIDALMFEVIDRLLDKMPYEYRRLNHETVQKYHLTPTQILQRVSRETDISIEALKSKSRVREISDARKVYFRACREFTKASLANIGSLVNRDHATVMHGERVAREIPEIDKLYNKIYGKTRGKEEAVEQSAGGTDKREPVERPILPFRSMDPREQAVPSAASIVRSLPARGFDNAFSGYRPCGS